MPKKTFKIYSPGTDIYGMSTYVASDGTTDHVAIYPAVVKDVFISKNKAGKVEIEYWLSTPKGEDWGDSVAEDCVSESREELFNRMSQIWDNNAEIH